MTDEETIIVIGNLPVNGDECFDITKYQEAKARAIKAIDENTKLKEAVGKIKKEIKEWYWNADKQAIAKDTCVVDAMTDMFLNTIKKHTEGLV